MESFKAQTGGIEKGRGFVTDLELFEGEKPSLMVETP